MTTSRAHNVIFSSDDQANKTMILDLSPDAVEKPAQDIDADATVVLDLSATQVQDILEDTNTSSLQRPLR